MKSLNECREILNGIDDEIKRLFLTRMETVKDVALYKKENNMAVFDAGREAAMIERLSKDIDPELLPYYVDFLEAMLMLSKEYQKQVISD